MMTDDQDKKIMLAVPLGGIWPWSSFMVELARRTLTSLWEFMNRADNLVNTEDTLKALTNPRESELEQAK